MKKLLTVVTMTILFSPVSSIADRNNNIAMMGSEGGMTGAEMGKQMDRGSQSGSMMKTQDRMKTMIKQMDQVHSTKNFDKRDELIADHIMNMNKGIKEMRGMGGNMMKHLQGNMMNGNMKKMRGTPPGNMTERMQRMEERLDMIQIMLEQLIESRQAERAQKHGHL